MISPCFPWPALLVGNGEKALVLADLHLGFEFELVEKGINIPSQTGRIKEKILRLLGEVKPRTLIILGDLKHTIPKVSLQEWRDVPEFLEAVRGMVKEVKLVLGNHDGGIEVFAEHQITVHPSRGIVLDAGGDVKVGLFHGHAWPSPKLFEAKYWVIGHNHPAIQFRGFFGFKTIRQVWVKAPINLRKLTEAFLRHRGVRVEGNPLKVFEERFGFKPACQHLIILPAFNDLLGGLAINTVDQESLIGPVVRSKGVQIGKSEIFLTDGTYLGLLKNLKKYG